MFETIPAMPSMKSMVPTTKSVSGWTNKLSFKPRTDKNFCEGSSPSLTSEQVRSNKEIDKILRAILSRFEKNFFVFITVRS